MNLAKKMVSTICAIGMIFTMASSMIAQASYDVEAPVKLEIAQQIYDESTKEGTLAIALKDADKSFASGTALGDFTVKGIELAFVMDSDYFDTSLYRKSGKTNYLTQNLTIDDRLKAKSQTPTWDATQEVITVIYNDIAVETALNVDLGDDMSNIPICTLNFKLKDGVDNATIKLADPSVNGSAFGVMIETGIYADDYVNFKTNYKWGNKTTECEALATSFATLGKVASDDDDDDTTNAPVQVGDGVIEDTVEDATDAAVAYTQKFSAVAGNKVTWNLTCNKVGETDKISGSYTYTIANLETEGDVNIGLIIQYNPSVYENVTVTDGAIVTTAE